MLLFTITTFILMLKWESFISSSFSISGHRPIRLIHLVAVSSLYQEHNESHQILADVQLRSMLYPLVMLLAPDVSRLDKSTLGYRKAVIANRNTLFHDFIHFGSTEVGMRFRMNVQFLISPEGFVHKLSNYILLRESLNSALALLWINAVLVWPNCKNTAISFTYRNMNRIDQYQSYQSDTSKSSESAVRCRNRWYDSKMAKSKPLICRFIHL